MLESNLGIVMPISIEELQNVFTYKDGYLFRNEKQVGYYDKSCKYMRFKYKNKTYLIHRLIFAHHHGYFPNLIDHIDRNRLNNNIENLRECTKRCFNTVNSILRKDSTSGYKGVAKHNCGKWQSSVFKDGKRYYLGLFSDPIEAAIIYDIKAKELFGEFAKLNFKENIRIG